jgi:hypothetical protein
MAETYLEEQSDKNRRQITDICLGKLSDKIIIIDSRLTDVLREELKNTKQLFVWGKQVIQNSYN